MDQEQANKLERAKVLALHLVGDARMCLKCGEPVGTTGRNLEDWQELRDLLNEVIGLVKNG